MLVFEKSEMKPSVTFIIAIIIVVVSFGCQKSQINETTSNRVGDSGVEVPVVGDAQTAPLGTLCPLNNQTRSCTCDKDGTPVRGRQTCDLLTGWSACECSAVPSTIIVDNADASIAADPANNKGHEDFEWNRTVPQGGLCKAGHYEGEFEGKYIPSLLLGFAKSDVAGSLSFDLTQTSNGEFFEISGGHMEGLANDQYPFTGDIEGTLDCTTGLVDAYLKNCSYLLYLVTGYFEGPFKANYDKFNYACVNGVWSVTEPDTNGDYPTPLDVNPGDPLPSLDANPILGGVGNWKATYTP
jgi:hypothetical protein